jgi:hypothetical protein
MQLGYRQDFAGGVDLAPFQRIGQASGAEFARRVLRRAAHRAVLQPDHAASTAAAEHRPRS